MKKVWAESLATRWRIKVIGGNADQQMEAWKISKNKTLKKQLVVLRALCFSLSCKMCKLQSKYVPKVDMLSAELSIRNEKGTPSLHVRQSLCKLVQPCGLCPSTIRWALEQQQLLSHWSEGLPPHSIWITALSALSFTTGGGLHHCADICLNLHTPIPCCTLEYKA